MSRITVASALAFFLLLNGGVLAQAGGAPPTAQELRAEIIRAELEVNRLLNQLAEARRAYEQAADAAAQAGITSGREAEVPALEARAAELRRLVQQLEQRLAEAQERLRRLREAAAQPPAPVVPPAPPQPPVTEAPPPATPAAPLPPAQPVVPVPPSAPTTPRAPCDCQEGERRTYDVRIGKIWWPYGKRPGQFQFALGLDLAGILPASVDMLQAWWLMLQVEEVCQGGVWRVVSYRTWFREIDGDFQQAGLGEAQRIMVEAWLDAGNELAEKVAELRTRLAH